jgi:5-methylcytosine-specific restriction endonuclease McrA
MSIRKKQKIPKALREQVWRRYIGDKFKNKCYIVWCSNTITVFDFHVGHDLPESKGGSTVITNLRPICSRCNHSMGANYTIQEWQKLGNNSTHNIKLSRKCCCIIS